MEVAKAHDLWVVEDCCDAFGATYRGKPVGSYGHLGTLSFYPAHHITTGEELSADERATTFDQMIELVLETAVRAVRELD